MTASIVPSAKERFVAEPREATAGWPNDRSPMLLTTSFKQLPQEAMSGWSGLASAKSQIIPRAWRTKVWRIPRPPSGARTHNDEFRSEEHTSELQSLRHLVC